ncbi:MAG TPA: chemotaxis protein CheX [Turneriella sp.]|nr:chemotaxis protein CheX [Turneriella sp.]HMY10161.1 chemotaxis protein CheX [Turneriella sp.]HNE19784.1 chemotaxis protein CheX [Turneriella sp.]HNM99195.1 chemotaxis protein CheX [Turneriella sp.]
MLDFEVFTSTLRNVFLQFIGIKDLTSENLPKLPDKFQSVTARIELSGTASGTLWLNISHPGVVLAMQRLNIPNSDEDRMMMDAAGELLNIIVGAAQRNSPVRYDFSLPSAYKGDAYPLRFAENSRKSARRFIYDEFEAILILEQDN